MPMVKKILIGLFIIIIALYIGISSILNGKDATAFLVKTLIERANHNIDIKDISIGEQSFNGFADVSGKDFQMSFSYLDQRVRIGIKKFDVNNIFNFVFAQDSLNVLLREAVVQHPYGTMQKINIDLFFSQGSQNFLQGLLGVKRMEFFGLKGENLQATFQINRQGLASSRFSIDTYRGWLSGDASAQLRDPFVYQVDMDIGHVNLRLLEDIDSSLNNYIKGAITGSVFLKAENNTIDNLMLDLHTVSDASIKAGLLALLLAQIPDQLKSEELKILIRNNGDLPLDRASLELENFSVDQATLRLDLLSKKYYLNSQLTIDLRLGDEFTNAFQSLRGILQ